MAWASATERRFQGVMARSRVIATIAPADSVERYTKLGVDVRLGHATIVDPVDGGDQGRAVTERLRRGRSSLPLGPSHSCPTSRLDEADI
jgi:hypothetical protein